MDSSGPHTLITAERRTRQAGRRLALVQGPPQVRRLLELTRLAERLHLVTDPAAALDGP